MPRLSTIAIDSRGSAPPQWSAAWVQRRLVEAYNVERKIPGNLRGGPLIASAWPSMAVEWADLLGRADEARQQVFQNWEHARLGVSAQDISRMDEAQDWLAILAPYPEERLCLCRWAAALAYRRSVSRLLMQQRWSKPTFYRRVTAGAYVIALELIRQGQPVR
jgi:hypothetical protein